MKVSISYSNRSKSKQTSVLNQESDAEWKLLHSVWADAGKVLSPPPFQPGSTNVQEQLT